MGSIFSTEKMEGEPDTPRRSGETPQATGRSRETSQTAEWVGIDQELYPDSVDELSIQELINLLKIKGVFYGNVLN
jgi:hypothetical protein